MHGRVFSLTRFVFACGLATAGLAFAEPPPQNAVAKVVANAGEREFRDADELLTALERADEGMVSLTADVRYDRTTMIQGDHQVNLGRLYFVTGLEGDGKQSNRNGRDAAAHEQEGGRKFAIRFNQRIVDGVVRSDESMFIFDGQWLVEKNFAEQLFIKRQVVPPGESFDPLRIGEGPMPLPIGQKREDILARYEAELLDQLDGLDEDPEMHPEQLAQIDEVREFVRDAYQVRLTPHAHLAEQDDFREVRLWYVRGKNGHLLPRMARTVSRAEDVSLVRLVDVQVQMTGAEENPDAEVPPQVLDTSVPRDGWHVQVTDWRGRAPGAGQDQGGR